MRFWLWILMSLAVVPLAGCATNMSGKESSPDEVAQAAYRHDGPPALTLYTMVNNNSGSGAHTSMMVNGSQRVIFDPAGSVRHPKLPEQGDVLYGVTPDIADFYARAHARETFHVIIQRIEVSPQVAERALQLVRTNGSVAQTQCAQSTASILRQLPGFENIRPTWFPNRLSDQFGAVPGVSTRSLYENDADDKSVAIRAFDTAPNR